MRASCRLFVKLHKERGSGLFSAKDCNLRHSEYEKMMRKPEPTHTFRELCKLLETASILKEELCADRNTVHRPRRE